MSVHDEATLAKINKLLHEAVMHHQAGRLDEAEPLYVEALNIEPRIPDAQHFYGVLLLQSGRHALALGPLQKAVTLNESQPAFRNNLGLALKALGQEEAAVEAFEAALNLAPEDYDARLNLGVTLQKMQRLDAAVSHYEKAIKINPKNPAAYKNLGAALKQQGQIVQAIDVYSKALELQPGDVDILINLGNALHHQHHYSNALEAYQQALQLKPNDAEIHFYIGNTLRKSNQNAQAIAAYQSAIDLAPQHIKANFELGCIWHQEGNYDEAIRYYRITIGMDEQHLDAMNNLGTILVELKQFDDALGFFRRAIDIDETFIKAWNNLGNTLQEMGHTDEAIRVYERALLVDPNSSPRVQNLNGLQTDFGHSRIDDTWQHIYHQLSSLLNAKGEKGKATANLRKWLEMDADNPIAQHMLAAQTGENVPERASDVYIKEEFDQFAQTFDDRLKELEYRAPDLMAQQLRSVTEKCGLDILDAGCGTGMCGPLIRDRAGRLIGVDLSKGMLDKAKVRDCYDDLIENELVAYLKSCKSKFDVILSADTLNYFGNLTDVFRDTRNALHDDGWFLFTLEVSENGDSSSGFTLNSHGRYSHPETYIRNELAQAGFRIHSMDVQTLRKEAKKEVAGWIIAAQPAKRGR